MGESLALGESQAADALMSAVCVGWHSAAHVLSRSVTCVINISFLARGAGEVWLIISG